MIRVSTRSVRSGIDVHSNIRSFDFKFSCIGNVGGHNRRLFSYKGVILFLKMLQIFLGSAAVIQERFYIRFVQNYRVRIVCGFFQHFIEIVVNGPDGFQTAVGAESIGYDRIKRFFLRFSGRGWRSLKYLP